MRSGAVAALAVALLAGLAGCADDGPDTGADPSGTPTGTQSSSSTTAAPPAPPPPILQLLVFDLVDCHGISVHHPRPLEDLQALLPEGFTAAPSPGAASPSAGAMAVDLYQCGNLTTATATVADTYVGLVYTYVERPVERVPVAPEVPVHEYVFRMLAGEDVLAQLWKAALYDTYNGTAAVADLGPPPLRAVQGTVGDGYRLVASGTALDALAGGRGQAFARYTVLAGDASVLMWTGTYDLPAAAAGPGSAEVPSGDPFASPAQRTVLPGSGIVVDAGHVRGNVLSRVFT